MWRYRMAVAGCAGVLGHGLMRWKGHDRWVGDGTWVMCVVEFTGRRRSRWAPGEHTELFVFDEATALAAGHRSCGECRDGDPRVFATAWAGDHLGGAADIVAVDWHLHADHLFRPGRRALFLRAAGRAACRRQGGLDS